jgi:hypothetical protein
LEESPRRHPPDPVARRDILREGRAEEYRAGAVVGLGDARPAVAEVELAVYVVLHEGYALPLQELDELALGLVGHAAPEGVVEVRHRDDGADGMILEGEGKGVEAHSGTGIGRYLEGFEVERLEYEEDAEIGGRLDGDEVARPANCL